MGGMETFTLVPRGPFSLAASTRFLEGFTPASYSSPADSGLELACRRVALAHRREA